MNLVSIAGGSLVNPSNVSKDGGNYFGTDYAGHAGGAISGLFWGLGFFPRANTDLGRKLKYWGMGLTAVYFILMGALLSQKKMQGS